MMRRTAAFAAMAAFVLAGCGGGPGPDATFDEDAPGADAAPESTDDDEEPGSGPVVLGRDDGEQEQIDLEAAAEEACGRAVTGSGRYSQAGYDRGVEEGMEAGHSEEDMVAAIEEHCGDEIAEARGD